MTRIEWPSGWERTKAHRREPNNRFEATLRKSIDDLEAELERIGVDDWRLSTGAEHQKQNPKYPYANARPDDPGAVVRWTMGGDQYAAACDKYTRLRDNVRSLYFYLHEKRKMEQRPVVTGQSEFANARLPPGDDSASDEDRTAVVAQPSEPHEVLGVAPGAPEAAVRGAFRTLAKEHHPDAGGDQDTFKRYKEARDELLSV